MKSRRPGRSLGWPVVAGGVLLAATVGTLKTCNQEVPAQPDVSKSASLDAGDSMGRSLPSLAAKRAQYKRVIRFLTKEKPRDHEPTGMDGGEDNPELDDAPPDESEFTFKFSHTVVEDFLNDIDTHSTHYLAMQALLDEMILLRSSYKLAVASDDYKRGILPYVTDRPMEQDPFNDSLAIQFVKDYCQAVHTLARVTAILKSTNQFDSERGKLAHQYFMELFEEYMHILNAVKFRPYIKKYSNKACMEEYGLLMVSDEK